MCVLADRCTKLCYAVLLQRLHVQLDMPADFYPHSQLPTLTAVALAQQAVQPGLRPFSRATGYGTGEMHRDMLWDKCKPPADARLAAISGPTSCTATTGRRRQ